MINRPDLINAVETAVRRNPISALVGPRQCGKTTLPLIFCADAFA
jgi:predicted AAA+ superfamily ATPase